MRVKRLISKFKLNEKCPYCKSNTIWKAKTNVDKKCTKCKNEIKHTLVVKQDKYKRLYNSLEKLN